MTDDDDPTPPRLPRAPSVLRAKTQDDRRYTEGVAARKARDEAAPLYICADPTGTYTMPEDRPKLKEARSGRTTEERFEHLESKHDALDKAVTETRVIVGQMSGKLDILPSLVDELRLSANVQRQDTLDVAKNRRARWTKVIGLLTSGGVVIEVLHRLGIL